MASIGNTLQYGSTPTGRAAHIYDTDEDVSLCGWELVTGVTDRTAFTLCRKCKQIANKLDKDTLKTLVGVL